MDKPNPFLPVIYSSAALLLVALAVAARCSKAATNGAAANNELSFPHHWPAPLARYRPASFHPAWRRNKTASHV